MGGILALAKQAFGTRNQTLLTSTIRNNHARTGAINRANAAAVALTSKSQNAYDFQGREQIQPK